MATFQAHCLLRKLKKAQVKEDNNIAIILSTMKAGVIVHQGEERETPIVDISEFKGSLRSILPYLQEKNYIQYSEEKLGREEIISVRVCHAGWHIWQTLFYKVLSFLFRSIAVPIVVAFLTSLVTVIAAEVLK